MAVMAMSPPAKTTSVGWPGSPMATWTSARSNCNDHDSSGLSVVVRAAPLLWSSVSRVCCGRFRLGEEPPYSDYQVACHQRAPGGHQHALHEIRVKTILAACHNQTCGVYE